MPRSCRSSDVDGASMSYPRNRSGRWGGITSHGNIAGTQEWQRLTPRPVPLAHDRQKLTGKADFAPRVTPTRAPRTSGVVLRRHERAIRGFPRARAHEGADSIEPRNTIDLFATTST